MTGSGDASGDVTKDGLDTVVAADSVGRTGPGDGWSGASEGEHIGRFIVLRRLGQGGMGVVYAAYDPDLDRQVALKLLLSGGGAGSTAGRARLLREAQAMAKLTHPNVITVHEVGEIELGGAPRVYVVMELVDGEDLGARVASQAASKTLSRAERIDDVLRMFVEAGRGLAAAHAVGLVHRDFKPDNVLVGNDGRVRVLDFGLARMTEAPELTPSRVEATPSISGSSSAIDARLTKTGALMGTPAYMSPEQYQGESTDERTDQFSFCVALWEALFDNRPFAGDSVAALMFSVLEGPLPEPPRDAGVKSSVREALVRGLSRDSSQRFGSMEQLLEVLERQQRHWFRTGLLAAAVATLVAGLGFGAWELTRPGQVELSITWNGEPYTPDLVTVGDVRLPVVDGVARGEVAAGTHLVHVEADGFRSYDTAVEVGRGGTHQLAAPLIHAQGTFELEVEPRGGMVLVDGVDYGSRLRNFSVDTGPHQVVARREGHFDARLEWSAAVDKLRTGYVYLPRAVVWSESVTANNHGLNWISDATGDGRPEISYRASGELQVYDPWQGALVWAVYLGDSTQRTGRFADLNGDGITDAVGSWQNPDEPAQVTVWDGSRIDSKKPRVLWTARSVPGGGSPEAQAPAAAPLLADVDGDGGTDVIVPSLWEGRVAAYRGSDGRLLWTAKLDGFVNGLVLGEGPTAKKDRLFAMSETQAARIELKTGEVQWTRDHQFDYEDMPSAPERSKTWAIGNRHPAMPAALDGVRGDDVVAAGTDGKRTWVVALAGEDGDELWRVDTGDRLLSQAEGERRRDFDGDGSEDLLLLLRPQDINDPDIQRLVSGKTGQLAWEDDRWVGFVDWNGQTFLADLDEERVELADPWTRKAIKSFPLPAQGAGTPVVLDHDGDGRESLVVGLRDGSVMFFDEDGRIVDSLLLEDYARGVIANPLDGNGDGMPDLLIETRGPTVVTGPRVRWKRRANEALRGAPQIADVDEDDVAEVVIGGPIIDASGDTAGIRVLDARNGAVERVIGSNTPLRPPLVFESAQGWRAVSFGDYRGGLFAYDLATGENLLTRDFPQAYGNIELGDLDADGKDEIWVFSWDDTKGRVEALDPDNWSKTWEWATPTGSGSWNAPQILDVEGDGQRELLVALTNGAVHLVARDGTERWTAKFTRPHYRPPTATDLDGDGVLEVLVSTRDEPFDLVVLDGKTGEEVRRFDGFGASHAPIVRHDIDGDGNEELIVASTKRGVMAMSPEGEIRWTHALTQRDAEGGNRPAGPIVLTDLDANGDIEILLGTRQGILEALDAETGELEWRFDAGPSGIEAMPAAHDVDGDGLLEVFVATHDRELWCLRGVPARTRR